MRKYKNKWNAEHRQENIAWANNWRKKNLDRVLKASSEYYNKNKEHIKVQRKSYRKKYRVELAAYQKMRYNTNIQARLAAALRRRLRQSVKNCKYSALELLGCNVLELKIHLQNKFETNMSWQNYGKWHIDHIRPLCSFDLNDTNDLAIACHYTNLQPLWASENLSKGGKYE